MGSHRSRLSLQVSVPGLLGSPDDTHVPEALQVSLPLQNTPSSHEVAAGRLLHDVRLDVLLQNWQGNPGLEAPFA